MKGLTEQLQDNEDRADMTPMIDCVFLLLLFFIVTATFSDETIFQVELPQAETPDIRKVTDVVEVYITKDGLYSIGERPVPEEQLLSALKQLHEKYTIRTIIIKGDRRCPYENVVRVVDIVQTLRIEEFSLAVKVES